MTGTQAELNEAEPNVFVAHLKDGIEVVRLQTGRTICKLHLASPGLHVDLNGDGVLDHLQATGVTHGHINALANSDLSFTNKNYTVSHKRSALQQKQHRRLGCLCHKLPKWTRDLFREV